MKIFFPWVLVVALLAAGYFLFGQIKEKDAQIAKLNQDNMEVAQLRSENDELKKISVQAKELEQLRKEHDELLGLRSETQRSRDQIKQLNMQLASAQVVEQKAQELQQEAAKLSTENLNLQNQQQEAAKEAKIVQMQYDTCIKNLRIIDGAKQAWALENKKTADDTPTPEELAPYLPKDVQIVCPAGGNYSINSMRSAPSCSVPAHALGK
jgi:DNA repair exonuclease SbcCD ATPase subunit